MGTKYNFYVSDENGGHSAGIFESPWGACHMSAKEIKHNRIILVSTHRRGDIILHLKKIPKEIYIDSDGALWIGQPNAFNPKLIAKSDGKILNAVKGGDKD